MSNEAVKQAVIAGLGYSLIPLIGMKNELINEEMHIIPSKSLPIINSWRLIWLKSKKLSPVAKEFLKYVSERQEQIVKKHFSWYLDFEK
jgi:DNA-binding transcriptional LysR family regulator